MTIGEMHQWFRQTAQEMGMQNVRAILPEQIDMLINTSIKDTIDEVVNRHIGTTNDRVITDNSKLANINALRTLYKVVTIGVKDDNTIDTYANKPYVFGSEELDNSLYFVDFSIRYGVASRAAFEVAYESITTGDEYLAVGSSGANAAFNSYAGSSTESAYNKLATFITGNGGTVKTPAPTKAGSTATLEEAQNARVAALAIAEEAETLYATLPGITRWFPIRVIDDAYLADVLNDWVLAPRMRTPAMVVYAKDNDNVNSQFELYVGENLGDAMASIISTTRMVQIRCSYIKKPNEVHYLSDVGGVNVDCDLPEQLQIPMLKHAVDLYRVSIQGNLFANQENARANQQELARNEQRPVNEGYQS